MTFGSPRNGLKKKKRKMLSPARNAQREEEIQYIIDSRMDEELEDFFEYLDEDIIDRNRFEDKLKGHMLHTLICMKNKENIQDDIDDLWETYQNEQKEKKNKLIKSLMKHHENLDPLGKIGFYMRFNDVEEVVSSLIYQYIFHQ